MILNRFGPRTGRPCGARLRWGAGAAPGLDQCGSKGAACDKRGPTPEIFHMGRRFSRCGVDPVFQGNCVAGAR
jgi:hypothetical protein